MITCVNLSNDSFSTAPFRDAAALRAFYEAEGCDGVELILCGDDLSKFGPGTVKGLHLPFYPEWISFWRGDTDYLLREFGSEDAWKGFYACQNGAALEAEFRRQLDLAERLGVRYVVFHMGDNAIDEFYTLRARRTAEEQIDESCAFLNRVFAGGNYTFDLLLENMWLGCMTLTEPAHVRRALAGVAYPRTGLMLDTGHLSACNADIKDGEDACRYIHGVLDAYGGEIERHIKGVHLHIALSGAYTRTLPHTPPKQADYLARYAEATVHLRQIDCHNPFVADGLPALIGRIAPDYLCHELAHGGTLEEWRTRLRAQTGALRGESR